MSVKDARERRDQLRTQLANDIDLGVPRKVMKAARTERAANSFEMIAREWFAKHSPSWADSHSGKIILRLERDVFPCARNHRASACTPRRRRIGRSVQPYQVHQGTRAMMQQWADCVDKLKAGATVIPFRGEGA